MVADRRKFLEDSLGDAAVALSDEYRKVGKYEEARQLAADTLAKDANNADAKRVLEYVEDPIRTSPALTYEHAQNVEEVRRKLYIAEGNHNLGKFEDAQKTYEEVLRIDPYNKAARRGMEKVAAAKADYYRAAYDHTRAQLLIEEDEVPETPGALEQKKQAALDLMSEVISADEPFSTFSLHVSDASFKLAQAAMERGEVPAAEGIRPEEFYNAFDYGDPAPANGEPVVCVTEQSAHPAFAQRNLLRIGVRTGSQGRGASTPLNLTLLLDHSGSMEREDRNAGLAMAVRQLSSLLKEGDTITVAGFSRQPRLLADRLPGARAQELNELIARTPSEGGTNLEEGLKLGEELAKRQFNPAAQNRVVLFTDGAANLGDARPEALQARIEGLRQQGIAFDAAGFGADGLNDKLLERLTRNGNGRYYVVDGPEDADAGFAKQLAGAFRPAAENVKVQVRFNPARVAKYKLIGFEEHRLQKEDFRNDAVDAAEMAAEEAGNALYQIETLPQGEGEVGEVSVRFRDVASGQMVERTWTIPYDAQAPAFDKATPSIQLAGLAAFTAEKLRAAPMADAVDFQQLGQVYAGVRARYPNSKPVADLGSMIGKMK
jgi:secreted protein with Ig-like and vWFA domain